MKTLISILVFSIFAVGIECSFNRLKLFTEQLGGKVRDIGGNNAKDDNANASIPLKS